VPLFVTTGSAIVSATVFAILFVWVSLALGRCVSRWLGVSAADGSVAERGVVALALGVGVLEFVPLTLGATGLLSVQAVRIAVVALALLAVRDLTAVGARVLALVKHPKRPADGWFILWLLALVPGLVIAYLLAVTPALDPDGLGYHLTVPKRWLHLGSLAYLPTYTFSNMPMGMELLFAIGMSFVGDAGAKLLHFCLGSAGTIGVFLAGRRLHSPIVGAVAVAFYLFGPFGVAPQLGWSYVEGAVSFAVVASLVAWLIWYDTRHQGWLRVAFAVAGIAVSIKITSALFPLGLALLTWSLQVKEARRLQQPVMPILLATWPLVLLAGIPLAPWLLRAALLTGNPFFPMLATMIPSRDFSPAVSADWDAYFRYMNWGTRRAATWDLETRKLAIGGSLVAILVFAGIIAAILRSTVARSTALVVGAMVALQVGAVGFYRRHWIAVMSVLQILMVAQAMRLLPQRWQLRPGRWQQAGVVALTLALSLVNARMSLASVGQDLPGLVQTAIGVKPQRDFLAQHLPLYTIYEYANRHLPPDAGVVFDFGCGGFHVDRETFCMEIPHGALSVESFGEFVADARRLGVTHVIAPRVMATGTTPVFEFSFRSGPGFEFRRRTDAMLVQLLMKHGQLLAAAADQGLYAVDLNAAQAAP
jgi:hypothetical protein